MFRFRSALAGLLLAAVAAGAQAQPTPKTKTKPTKTSCANRLYQALAPAEIDRRVEALLAQMTLEEKVGQMAQVTLDVVGKGKSRTSADAPYALDPARLRDVVVKYHIGSLQNSTNNRACPPAT
ncbi:hypothetical protein [Hymenobacter sp. PAMC 26628]|uniref:hypothetical protein n=1 Tax=Hymenobacter sp. PAMC 26628 TaxID=1484118 RepID=UPI000A4FDDE7|nr:hypothetical protein [Hymenobacter sp. PAMC 26628]